MIGTHSSSTFTMSNPSFLAMSPSQRLATLVVIDSAAENYRQLISGVEPGAQVVVLSPDQDGIQQIAEAIACYCPQSVHLIAHGAPGCLYLGNGELSLSSLEHQAEALSNWFATEKSQAELVIYGCRVAAGDAGEELVEKLHRLTGASVFASTRPVGASDRGTVLIFRLNVEGGESLCFVGLAGAFTSLSYLDANWAVGCGDGFPMALKDATLLGLATNA